MHGALCRLLNAGFAWLGGGANCTAVRPGAQRNTMVTPYDTFRPRSLATILSIVRDIGYLMDSINTSTAVHRLGKLARRRREVDAGEGSCKQAHQQPLQR